MLSLFDASILGNCALDRLANASFQVVIDGAIQREKLSPLFAAAGGSARGGSLSQEQLNVIKVNIQRQLQKQGLPVTHQYGVAGYRLDLARVLSEHPGRVVFAFEADGVSYH